MCSQYSDTIAREQQIRELSDNGKTITPTVRTRQNGSKSYDVIIIAIIQIIFSVYIFGRFTINNAQLIREAYYILIATSNETFTETSSVFQKNR